MKCGNTPWAIIHHFPGQHTCNQKEITYPVGLVQKWLHNHLTRSFILLILVTVTISGTICCIWIKNLEEAVICQNFNTVSFKWQPKVQRSGAGDSHVMCHRLAPQWPFQWFQCRTQTRWPTHLAIDVPTSTSAMHNVTYRQLGWETRLNGLQFQQYGIQSLQLTTHSTVSVDGLRRSTSTKTDNDNAAVHVTAKPMHCTHLLYY